MTDISDNRPPVDSVAIVSGGMDSVTLLYAMKTLGYRPRVLSFNYGQRHKKELEFAKYHATALDLPWHCIDLSGITHLINNSALTSAGKVEVPEGHYADDNMKLTVVPNRNMMMLSIAGAVVVNDKALTLGIGVHGGDHAIYPDCRPEFIEQFEETLKAANVGFIQRNFRMFAPFLHEDKAYIVESGEELNVDWTKTWSCYKGGEVHCGKCATCVERREAFALAGFGDPTEYEDKTNYWKQVTQNA
jgi:7-cyano-7-deazaguanine synthase